MSDLSKENKTRKKANFKERYKTGDTPWDLGKADLNLVNTITERLIGKGKALDIGCGRGDNAVWLARKNFRTTGCDLSKIAVVDAAQKASEADVECEFIALDFLKDEIPGAPFDLAFDRGCFHSFGQYGEKEAFARKTRDILTEGGLWLSLIGNADDDAPTGIGPPRLTATDITSAVEPFFEILSLATGYFDSMRFSAPKAWICLMRKRSEA